MKSSASSRWRERALAAEVQRDEIQEKYDELLDRLTGALAGALVAGGYVKSVGGDEGVETVHSPEHSSRTVQLEDRNAERTI